MPVVKVLPANKTIETKNGENLLDVLERNGFQINTRCAKKGICGRCIVKLNSREVLSCKTVITDDAEVFIPSASKLENIYSDTSLKFKKDKFKFSPSVRKINLKIPAIEKNLAGDWEKITSALSKFYSSKEFVTPLENFQYLSKLVRNSCGDITLTLYEDKCRVVVTNIEKCDTSSKNYGIAIDVGTTTVVVYLFNINSAEIIDARFSYNRQVIYGEDVITRIIFTEEKNDGLKILHNLIIQTINDLINKLIGENHIDKQDINYIVFAGNTTMTHIVYNIFPEYLRKEPYSPVASFFPSYYADKIGLDVNRNAIINSSPCVSGYMGGDITAGILATEMPFSDELSMLVDVGTNGEIALGNKDFIICAACSAGPAFEGVGIRSGTHAVGGAISKISITKNEIKYETIGGEKPKGICGSGLIELLSELLKNKIINQLGKFEPTHPRVQKYDYVYESGLEFVIAEENETSDGEKIVLTEIDIQNLLRAKGAVYLGIEVLLKETGFNFNDLKKVYISGGFGNYIQISKAIMIGLLPDIPTQLYEFIGNSSVTGAGYILLSGEAKDLVNKIAEKMTYIDLSTNPTFMNEYSSTLFLPHTNLDLFPTVKKILKQ